MTANQRKVAVGVVTILIGAALIGAANAVEENVIFRPEFEREVNDVRDIALDHLCLDHPNHRRCK